MNTPGNLSRRLLLKAAGASVAVAFTASAAHANEDLPPLEEDDSSAEDLGYVADSGSVLNRCGACAQYTGHPNADSGPCSAFPKNSVMNAGWCSAFSPVDQ